MSLETTAGRAANETMRIPANVMTILRQSYNTREKMLDWILAIAVTAAMAYAFREPLRQMCGLGDNGPNAGRDDEPVPSQDTDAALPNNGKGIDLYTYNMPVSRSIRYAIGPSATRMPSSPSLQPGFP